MKFLNLTSLENKYYYNFVRYLTHILIGITILAFFISLLVFLWSIIPVSKPHVVKGPKPVKMAYPEPEIPKIDEVKNVLSSQEPYVLFNAKMNSRYFLSENTSAYYQKTKTSEIEQRETQTAFLDSMENLKKIIPVYQNEKFWKGIEKDGFASERDRKLFKKTKNPKYKTKIRIEDGFINKFINYTSNLGYTNFNDKTTFLNGIDSLLKTVNPINRLDILEQNIMRIYLKKYQPLYLKNRLYLIAPILKKLPADSQKSGFVKLFNIFGSNDYEERKQLLSYYNSTLDSVANTQRLSFIDVMNHIYLKRYKNDFSRFKKLVNAYLKILPEIPAHQQAEGLLAFDEVYKTHINDIQNQIYEIDRQYAQTLKDWESDFIQRKNNAYNKYYQNKNTKSNLKATSLKIIAGAPITFLSLFLFVLGLSTLRNINNTAEKLYNQK